MFDRIMENSMAIWMLVSAAFSVFLFGTLIKAILHFRKVKALSRYMERVPTVSIAQPRLQSEDWVPSR